MQLFKGLFKARDKPKNEVETAGAAYRYSMGRKTPSGKRVSKRSAMQLTAVYACVKILSEAIAQLPLNVYRSNGNKGREKAKDHPLYSILHNVPNPEMTSFNFRETMMTHLLLDGNAYAQIIRNYSGNIQGLYILMPDKMRVVRNDAGNIEYKYLHSINEADTLKNEIVTLNRKDVLHIPGLGFDGLVGYSPIAIAQNAIGMADACEEYGAKFFENGARPGGVLEHPGTLKQPERLREQWESAFGGSSNSNKVAVLEEGMKYNPIAIAPGEAQFLETRQFQISEIARIFRIPPHMLGELEHTTYANIEQQSLEFVKYTLDPWICRWEQALEKALLGEEERKDISISFNVEGLLRGDYKSRMDGYAVARQNGWMSANDIRQLENLEQIPAERGGDLYLINGNMTKIEDAGIFANKGVMKEQ